MPAWRIQLGLLGPTISVTSGSAAMHAAPTMFVCTAPACTSAYCSPCGACHALVSPSLQAPDGRDLLLLFTDTGNLSVLLFSSALNRCMWQGLRVICTIMHTAIHRQNGAVRIASVAWHVWGSSPSCSCSCSALNTTIAGSSRCSSVHWLRQVRGLCPAPSFEMSHVACVCTQIST